MAKSDDEADEWGKALDGREAPAIGANEDMLRKALAVNPALKQGKKTTDILQDIKAAQSARTVAAPAAADAQKPKAKDIVEFFLQAKERYEADKKRLIAERHKIEAEEKALAPKLVERMIEVMLELDPNMTSPQTQEMLKMEAQFLAMVGFSARKVIERKMKK